MQETDLIIFIVITNLILLVFIGGIVFFMFQYRKRVVFHKQEKQLIKTKHEQDLLQQQLHIQQDTMKEIGQEIHDNIGQKLTLANIFSNQLSFESTEVSVKNKADEIAAMLNNSIEELRALSKHLVNPDMFQLPLEELLKHELLTISNTTRLNCDLEIKNDLPDFDINTKKAIFRITQEFIQNSLKHGKANQLTMKIEKKQNDYLISLKDNGIGFDVSQKREGIGLTNMRRRALDLKIDFEMNSVQNQGTILLLTLNNIQ